MTVRAAFFKPGEPLPYAQVYRPVTPPASGVPVILGGTLDLTRPGFSASGSLELSAPLAFEDGDWVRVWLSPERPDPDYLGEITSEAWDEGQGTVTLRGLTELLNTCRWVGRAEGDFPTFFRAVLTQATLPTGLSVGVLPAISARFKADVPHELLGDTIQAISPALGDHTIGVNNRAEIVCWSPVPDVTHRFVQGQSETPPGDLTNYANCVRFGFELPSGDTGWFEGRDVPEVERRRREVWTVEQLTARELGLPDEPLKGTAVEVQQAWRIGGQHVAELTSRVPLDRLGTPIKVAALDAEGNPVESFRDVPTLTRSDWMPEPYRDEGEYTPAADARLVRDDPTGAIYYSDAPADVQFNAWLDMELAARFNVVSDVSQATQKIREWLLTEHQIDLPANTIQRQLEVKVQLEYTRLGEQDGPLEALRLVQFVEGRNSLHVGSEYIDVLSTDPASVTLGVKVNPILINAAPVNQVPVAEGSEPISTDGTSSTSSPPPANAAPDHHRLALAYRDDYRRKLLAAGLEVRPIRLLDGGEIGGVVEVGDAKVEKFYPPARAGQQYLHVQSAEVGITKPLRLELPFPLPLPDKTPLEYAQLLTSKAGATLVTLPESVELPSGSAVLVSMPPGASLGAVHVLPEVPTVQQWATISGYRAAAGADGNATPLLSTAEAAYVYATVNKLGHALQPTDNPPEGTARFAVREDMTAQVLLLNGVNNLTGQPEEQHEGLHLLTPQLNGVQTYAAELLRYKSRPVRDWRGAYGELVRVPADGAAAFERPHADDELLDVQRVSYDLGRWTAVVQAGTPLPATDEDAVAGVIESVRRVQRRAGEQK